MKFRKIALGVALGLTLCCVTPSSSFAANGVDIYETSLKVNYQTTKQLEFYYTGAFSDLGVVVGDPNTAAAIITDKGNGKATLSVGSLNYGKTTLAVYKISNPAIVDYVTVYSGMTEGFEIKNVINGSSITTIYSDCVVEYNAVLFGKNNASAAVKGLHLDREDGMDRLMVSADIITDDSIMKGLATFQANFYDNAGQLIKTQDAFVKSNIDTTNNIYWYIPSNCVKIVIN